MAYAARIRLDDKLSQFFQPDILAEAKYSITLQRKQRLQPEEQLMLAVLEDAIFCFQKYLFARNRKGRALFEETERWILDSETNGVFSFGNICELMGICPDYLRRGLLRWKEQEVETNRRIKRKKTAARFHMVPYR